MDPVSLRRAAPSPQRPSAAAPPPASKGLLARLLPDRWVRSVKLADSFTEHVQDAIQSNQERREYYARVSNGASRGLSDYLIALERLTLPFAMVFDARAERFNQQGVPIVDRDLVPMSGVRPPQTPPRHRGVASEQDLARLAAWIATYRDGVAEALAGRDFAVITRLTADLLRSLEGLEASADAHFAMTKHVAESVGYAALHAQDYRQTTAGASDDLAARFIQLQAFGLVGTVGIDHRAQALHRQGLGIIVNDLPDIPFLAELEARRKP